MSGDRGASFPIAAISVVALFLSTTFLGQHAFEVLRLEEGDAAKQRQVLQPPVEARLWEDPLAAVVRHRARLKEICRPGEKDAPPADPRCPFDPVDAATLRSDFSGGSGDLTVIAALVPGAAFLGVEEARRRVRYSLLAALGVEGFAPDNSERMGLLTSARTDIPYETFSTEPKNPKRRVAVLWINDVSFGKQWLSALAALLGDLAPPAARLRIVGPYDSEALVGALNDDLAPGHPPPEIDDFKYYLKQLNVLSRLQIISPFSTATADRLVSEMDPAALLGAAQTLRKRHPGCMPPAPGEGFPGRLQAWFHNSDILVAAKTSLFGKAEGDTKSFVDCLDLVLRARFGVLDGRADRLFVRTIGTDARNLGLLKSELCVRGLADGNGGRIVVLREWDSIYARSFAQKLGSTLECGEKAPSVSGRKASIEVYSYLRGLDGANLDGAPKQQRLVPRSNAGKGRDDQKDAEIEWPESRDQRDYVRRLVTRIQQQGEEGDGNGKDRVRAIGVIGVDVHDKLILVQALRAAFPDRLLFTTDLDARLLHPEMLKHTRNLVIASSMALEQSVLFEKKDEIKVAPFRDVYQTATFLGVRYAVAREELRSKYLNSITQQLKSSELFEVSRNGMVKLSTGSKEQMSGADADRGSADSDLDRRQLFASLALVILAVLCWLMVFGRPAPAMKAAVTSRGAWSGSFDLSTAIIAGLAAAAWGFGFGVIAELAAPRWVGPGRVMLVALTMIVLFWVTVYPGPRPGSRLALRRLLRMVVVGLAALCGVFVVTPSDFRPEMREPFAALSGISGWPSQLLRTLLVLLFAWFLDHTWNRSAQSTAEIGKKYFQVAPGEAPPFEGLNAALRRLSERFRRWYRAYKRNKKRFWQLRRRQLGKFFRDASIWFWQPHIARRDNGQQVGLRNGLVDDGGMDGARLWRRYLRLLRNGPRFLRMAIWLGAVYVLVRGLMYVVDGEQPEVPARGLDDRALFFVTIMLAVVGTMSLLVLVGDSTVLTWRLIAVLKQYRTVYPSATVQRFAAELGPKPPPKVLVPIAARIEDRLKYAPPGNPAARNSVLDDWIDARLLAEHTAAIGPLIVFPFILLGLLIVARSPLFDNWAASGPVVYALVGYLLWSVAMATMLNFGAEIARRKIVDGMEKDRIWLEGAGKDYEMLATQFPKLIDQVRGLRQGAFAPFFEQPLVRAILVPLGGAGGIQLLEILAFARS